MSKGASRAATCLSLAGGLIAASITMPAHAQGGADYFKGKTVTYIVATAAGGGYDLYGRLVAEYMQRYLPGSTFIVRNLPGAGHLVGANTIYASRADGLTIGTFNTGLIYNQLVGLPGVKFDLTKMSWIGKATTEPRAITIAQQSPIKTFADLQASKEPINFADLRRRQRELRRDHDAHLGAQGALESPDRLQRQRRPAGDAPRRSRRHDRLAVFVRAVRQERLRPIHRADRRQGHRRAAAPRPGQRSGRAVADRAGAVAGRRRPVDRRPAGIPQAVLEALRNAYRNALEDKELQEKAAKLERPVEPGYGDDVLNAIVTALKQPPETIALLAQALKKK